MGGRVLQALVMEGTVKDRIGAHVPKLFSRVAALAARVASGGADPPAGGDGAAARLAGLQEEARKALLLVGPAK